MFYRSEDLSDFLRQKTYRTLACHTGIPSAQAAQRVGAESSKTCGMGKDSTLGPSLSSCSSLARACCGAAGAFQRQKKEKARLFRVSATFRPCLKLAFRCQVEAHRTLPSLPRQLGSTQQHQAAPSCTAAKDTRTDGPILLLPSAACCRKMTRTLLKSA